MNTYSFNTIGYCYREISRMDAFLVKESTNGLMEGTVQHACMF